MTELVERYVHQVGRYLPPKDRNDIQAELRSTIQDQLDDRFGGAPSPEEVAAVLTEFGNPYKMATSYNRDQYLVGPDLYPVMMIVLRRGWLLVPLIVVCVNIIGALVSAQASVISTLVVDTVIGAIGATFLFSAVVIMVFAVIQHADVDFDAMEKVFNPMNLPKVDDPGAVDRVEAFSGIAIGVCVMLLLLYFIQVGGLTLRFDLSNHGTVIPVPAIWLTAMTLTTLAMVVMELLVLRRQRWNFGLYLIETLLELFGAICLYIVLWVPIFEQVIPTISALAQVPFLNNAPNVLLALSVVSTLLNRGTTLIKLWNTPVPHSGQ